MTAKKGNKENRDKSAALRLIENPSASNIGAIISPEEGEKLKALIKEINGRAARAKQINSDPGELPPAA